VEYIDVDDFKPGGKYGPPQAPSTAVSCSESTEIVNPSQSSDAMQKASSVIAESVASSVHELFFVFIPCILSFKLSIDQAPAGTIPQLSSNLWMDLLD